MYFGINFIKYAKQYCGKLMELPINGIELKLIWIIQVLKSIAEIRARYFTIAWITRMSILTCCKMFAFERNDMSLSTI